MKPSRRGQYVDRPRPPEGPLPVLHVDGRAPAGARAFWQYRGLFVELATRDLRMRYRGMALGVWWSLLFPIVQIAIYYFAFVYVLGVSPTDRYLLFVTIGIVHWSFLSGVATVSPMTVVNHFDLADKVRFPRLILPWALTAAAFVQHCLMLVALAAVFPFLGGGAWWGLWMYLPVMLLAVVFAAGVAMLLSAVTVFFRDLDQLVSLAMAALFFVSPVVYRFERLPWNVQYVLSLSPFYAFLEGFKAVLFDQRAPVPGHWAIMVGWAVVAWVAGWAVFSSLERRFTDVV
jgi:lipopolysaccharide transport system permease protein